MLLVCGTRYQFLFCRYWQLAILQGYLGARQDGDQITTILHHHHLITNILQDGGDFGSGANVLSFLTLF
jgi:hypothetical protein